MGRTSLQSFFGKSFSFRAQQKKHRTAARRSSQIGFESLEKREVMAANVTAVFSSSTGVLTVEGTPGNDTINVRYDGSYVSVDGVSIGTTGANGAGAAGAISQSWISSIKVSGLGGN